MNYLKYYFSIFIGKASFYLLKLFGLGATAAPGLYAGKIDKDLIKKLAKQLKYSIIISGTNGKTTTSRILAEVFQKADIKYFHNRTGSNLERGIISELLKNISLKGLPKNRVGLWEIDEAVFPIIAEKIKPKIIVLTNLFRDQLDRYGEIDTLAKKWQQALKKLAKSTTVILNADDPTIVSLAKSLKCRVIYFGIRDKTVGSKTLSHASDATMCPNCLEPLNYQTCFVSHLGIFNCPNCSFSQPKAQISAQKIKFLKNGFTQVSINSFSKKFKTKIKLAGIYNVYNLLAAFSLAKTLKIKTKIINQAVLVFKPAFGRFEEIKIKNHKLQILLAKNPAGFNQVIKTLPHLSSEQKFSLLIALNDKIADGRDVSWIWDVDFKYLKNKNIDKIMVSGIRSKDMALRLKYAGIEKLEIYENLKKAIITLINQSNKNLFIIPTYTAMLEARKILNKMGLVHSTWKD